MPSDSPTIEPPPVTNTPTGPTTGGKGWSSWSNNKKIAVAGGVGLVVAIGVYLYAKHRAASSTATTGTGTTLTLTPTNESGNPGSFTGVTGGGQNAGSSNLANLLAQNNAALEAWIASNVPSSTVGTGTGTISPTGGVNPGGPNQPASTTSTPASIVAYPNASNESVYSNTPTIPFGVGDTSSPAYNIATAASNAVSTGGNEQQAIDQAEAQYNTYLPAGVTWAQYYANPSAYTLSSTPS